MLWGLTRLPFGTQALHLQLEACCLLTGPSCFPPQALPSVEGSRLCPFPEGSLHTMTRQGRVSRLLPCFRASQLQRPPEAQLRDLSAKHPVQALPQPCWGSEQASPKVLLWHIHYVELKAIKTLQNHKKCIPFP